MKSFTPMAGFGTTRAFLASFLTCIMLVSPLTSVGFAAPVVQTKSKGATQRQTPPASSTSKSDAPKNEARAPQQQTPPVAPSVITAANITATKTDTIIGDSLGDGKAQAGDTIRYDITILNNSATDTALNLAFNDTIDPNTTLVANSILAAPQARDDAYTTVGNTLLEVGVAAGAAPAVRVTGSVFDNDTNATDTRSLASFTQPANGTLTFNTNGNFTYLPNAGFTGPTDSFTYTIRNDADTTLIDTATVTITISNRVWYVNTAAAAGGDGRSTSPFNTLTPVNGAGGAGDVDAANDIIYLFTSGTNYSTGLVMEAGQQLIGNGVDLIVSTFTLRAAGSRPTVSNSAGNGVTLSTNNTVRGLNIGDTGGADISGTSFGTLTADNISLIGTGRTLSLTTGTLAATFDVLTSTSSTGGEGLLLSGVAGSLTSTSGTSITSPSADGVRVTGSTLNASFGNTTVSGGTNGISLSNNTSGTRTFGTLSLSGNSAGGFVHNPSGGATTVTGATNITNPVGTGITIFSSNAAVSFAATTVSKNNSGTGVLFNGNGTNTTSFSSLAITTANGYGLLASNGGNITISAGSISATSTNTGSGAAIDATSTTINAVFTSLSSTNSGGATTGITLVTVSGSITSATTGISNAGGVGINVTTSAATLNFGNTTVSGSGGTGVSLATNTGAITFADLDISPDANQRAFIATDNTNTLTATSGDITTTGTNGRAVEIDGPAGRTPINLTFSLVTVPSTSNSISLVDVSGTRFQVTGTTQINTRSGTGIFVDNATTTTIQFGTTNIPNANAAGGYGIRVEDSSSAVTVATATISDANLTTGQTDANSDFIPDNDGDGDAIFLTRNTGSFTLNGGTLSNCGNDCIDVRTSSALVLSGVTINNTGVDVTGASGSGTGGHGIQAINLTGTNSISGGSTITNFDIAGRDGLRLINDVATAMTMTVQGTTFSNSDGSNGILISGRNAANMGVTVGGATNNASTNCTFTGLFGQAITHNSGDSSGSTATVNLTVQNSTFTSAPTNGSNTVSARNIEGAKANVQILNNTFTNIAQTSSDNAGALTVNGDGTLATNQLDITISGNTMSGIGNATTACGAGATPCDGPYGMLIFIDDQDKVGSTINIANNNVTNVRRTGLVLDMARGASGNNVNAKVTGNTFGTAAAPVGVASTSGQPGVTILSRCLNGASGTTCTKSDNVLFSNNIVTNNSTSGSNTATVFSRAEDDANLQLTATGNTIRNLGTIQEFSARAAFPIGAGSTVCLDMNGNTLDSGAGQIVLREDTSSTLNVEQASAAALASANSIPAGNVTVSFGTPQFGVTCAAPPAIVNPALENVDGFAAIQRIVDAETAKLVAAQAKDKQAEQAAIAATPAYFIGAPTQQQARANNNVVVNKANVNVESAASNSSAKTDKAGADKSKEKTTPGFQPLQAAFPVNIASLLPGESVTITFRVTVNNPLSPSVTQVSNQGQITGGNFTGTVLTDDPSIAGTSNPTVTPILGVPTIVINNASTAEPVSPNTATMPFTVALSAAYGSPVTVNYSTADGTATAGADYTAASGTLTFNPGEILQTVGVDILSDSDTAETNETFTLALSTPTNGILGATTTATGTITTANPTGTVLISEVRTSGPNGANDEFVELYNNTDAAINIGNFALVKGGASCSAAPIVVATIPAATSLPARGHYLIAGSAYSLGALTAANQTLLASNDIEDDRNLALFDTATPANFSTATRRDAVGFDGNNTADCSLLREGTNLAAASGSTSQYSFVRRDNFGTPKDTNNNTADFTLVSTTPATSVGATTSPTLGAPGPENLASPVQRNGIVKPSLVDGSVATTAPPNRIRSAAGANPTTAAFGTLDLRRRFTNTTGAPVTALRFRVVDITTRTTGASLPPAGTADLRLLTSTDTTATVSGGTVTITGSTLTAPAQPNGGGLNSAVTVALPGGALANGASINVRFVLGVQQDGNFRFLVNVEALPIPVGPITTEEGSLKGTATRKPAKEQTDETPQP